MGRRLKSTKSGKYINPTDQVRKEARKRELKKNKKQRLIVRAAVIKGKDPHQIIADLERLDRMEYDINNPPPLNEKVLRDKRRKLRETWDKICRHYIKEDRDRYLELKRMEGDYEHKRNELIKHYEAIKSTQEVNLDDIPLPSAIPTVPTVEKPSISSGPVSILKSRTTKQPPGCPPGLPPLLKEYERDSDYEKSSSEDEKEETAESGKKIRFSDEVDDKNPNSNSNVQEFLKEIEQLSTEKPSNDKDENSLISKYLDNQSQDSSTTNNVDFFGAKSSILVQPAPPIMIQTNPLPPLNPPQPPSHRMLNTVGQVIRIAPQTPLNYQKRPNQHPQPSSSFETSKKQTATIEARPQLRNLSADSTKFMPLSLRVRRDEKLALKKPTNSSSKTGAYGMVQNTYRSQFLSYNEKQNKNNTKIENKTNSKDDAYEQFMKEMNELI